MKIYTKLVMDWDGNVLEEDSYDYDGPVALCGSGGSSSTTVDKAYNARMATIAETQQGWAKEYFELWQDEFKPYEIDQVKANREMLPLETSLYKKQLEGANQLAPLQTEAAKEFLNASINGVDINERMALATADTASAWKDVSGQAARAGARMGVNPNSGRFMGINAALDTQKAAQLAGTRTAARVGAEQENYARLGAAAGFKTDFGGADSGGESYSPAAGLLQGISSLGQKQ